MSITNNRGRRLAMAGLAAAVLAASDVVCAQIPCGGYEVTAIIQAPKCPPFGFPPTIGRGISEPIDGGLPYVVGHVQSCVIGPDVAFLWTPDQGIQLIPTPPGTLASEAVDIEGTRIVGNFNLEGDGLSGLGFLYDFQTDEFTNLGTFPGGNFSVATAVNGVGQIAGYWGNFVNGDPEREAFIWENEGMASLAPDLGTPGSEAHDINCTGQVTGWMGIAPHIKSNAFIWDNGEVTELPPIPRGFTSIGQAISCSREVVGWGLREEGRVPVTVTRAFFWDDDNGVMIDLGTLPNHLRSAALDIRSDPLQIVGQSWNVDGNTNISHGFVWHDGRMIALDELVDPNLQIHIKMARAINDAGQILAQGTDAYSDVVSWLLRPIEPPPGDLDGDCHVGVSDLLMLLGDWGPCKNCDDCRADLDGDCSVGVTDLIILLGNWG